MIREVQGAWSSEEGDSFCCASCRHCFLSVCVVLHNFTYFLVLLAHSPFPFTWCSVYCPHFETVEKKFE